MDFHDLKKERDDAVKEVRTISVENRKKIGDLKQSFAKAGELKATRDKENGLAAEFRKKRDEAKAKADECKKKLFELRGKITAAGGGKNPTAIQEQVERLEWIQQTESLNAKEEKELAKRIKELMRELPQAEGFQSLMREYSAERDKLKKIFEEEKRYHEKMLEHSKKAQATHEALMAESKKIKHLQESVSSAMEVLKQKEGVADEKQVELVKTVGEKKLQEMEEHQREHAEEVRRQHAQHNKILEKAKEIYEKFKSGKKISSEDLTVLQQSGLV